MALAAGRSSPWSSPCNSRRRRVSGRRRMRESVGSFQNIATDGGTGMSHQRVLVIDDNPAIHEDFRKIFCPATPGSDELSRSTAAFFGEPEVLDTMVPAF